MPYVRNKDASRFYNVSDSALRKWARENLIPVQETKGGHWRYWIDDQHDQSTSTYTSCAKSHPNTLPDHIIYARVSSRKQARDLDAQSLFLKHRFPEYTLIRDIGSGVNYNRKGFKTLLEKLFQGNIKKVVVSHSDRFSCFSFEFFQWLFTYFGAVLETVEKPNDDRGSDLTTDLMEVLTVFTARYYGRRKYHRHTENQDLSDTSSDASV